MPSEAQHNDIDAPDLAASIEKLVYNEINTLPFGVIRLDAAGNVLFYSDVERQMSGLRKEAVGRSFFSDIAPCLGTERFRDRIDKAMHEGSLDLSYDMNVDLPSGAKDVDIHVRVQSANGGGCWIFAKITD